MRQKLLIILFGGLLFAACTPKSTSVDPDHGRVADACHLTPTRTVGTGSGNLTIDGVALSIQPGEVVAITPGTYSSIIISNLSGTASQITSVVANGLVEVVGGEFSLNKVAYLTIDGGTSTKNFLIRDISYRGMTISGAIPRELILQGLRFKNIGDYTIYYGNNTAYNQTDATALLNFKMLYCDFENAGSIQFSGNVSQSSNTNNGFVKNPEIAYCSFRNSPATGDLLFIGNAENMNIHHNIVDNVNTTNNNHNGIFHLVGNGSVHNNKCTNHQGNFVRFWPFSQGSTPKSVTLYNNIVWNSRKYSAFELQSFSDNLISGKTTYCNAKVYNNTVGRLNTTTPTVFVGVVVDVYNLYGGSLQIFNNLSFEQVVAGSNDGIWSQQSSTTPSLYSNNQYYSNASTAGLVDQTAFRLQTSSPAKGAGLHQDYLTDDYYNVTRAYTPSVGAVE